MPCNSESLPLELWAQPCDLLGQRHISKCDQMGLARPGLLSPLPAITMRTPGLACWRMSPVERSPSQASLGQLPASPPRTGEPAWPRPEAFQLICRGVSSVNVQPALSFGVACDTASLWWQVTASVQKCESTAQVPGTRLTSLSPSPLFCGTKRVLRIDRSVRCFRNARPLAELLE